MASEDAKRDHNRVTGVMAKSDISGEIRGLEVDELTNRLKVDATGTLTGAQYTAGDIDATPTGTLAMGQQSDNTITPIRVDATGNVQVDIVSGAGGTEYTDGDVDATPSGGVIMGFDGTNVRAATVDAAGDLQIDVLSSALPSGAATAANQTTIIGHVDGIEALLGTAATSAKQDTIIGHVDGVETLLGTIDGDTSVLAATVTSNKVQVDVITMPTINTESDGTALSNNQVAVDTTAGGTTILAASVGRQGVIITNQGSVNCYIGTGSVTTSNGFLLGPGESIGIPTDSDVKGITASSSTTIGYLALA
jgi:hypothetical protein